MNRKSILNIWITSTLSLIAAVACGGNIVNELPEIKNFKVSFNEKNNDLIITYDLFDKESELMKVVLTAVGNNGEPFSIKVNDLSGDIGNAVRVGRSKKILWKNGKTHCSSKNFMLRLTADDLYKIDIADVISKVDSNRIIADLSIIYGERNIKSKTASDHLTLVRDYIEDKFSKNGLETYRHVVNLPKKELYKIWNDHQIHFDSLTWDKNQSLEVQNIVGGIAGVRNPSNTILISAHYDSYPGSPGLDDNASGLAGMLEVMRVLSNYNFENSVKFAAFDMEEDGLVGSLSFVFKGGIRASEKIQTVLNLDMIGISSDSPDSQEIPEGFDALFPEVCQKVISDSYRGNFVIDILNETSVLSSQIFNESRLKYADGLKGFSLIAVDNGQQVPTLAASDHASFWYAGIPALHIGEGGGTRNPLMHSEQDSRLGLHLNFGFMNRIVKATAATVIELAKINHSTTVTWRNRIN